MKKYITSTLVYTGCFIVSLFLGGLVSIIPAIGIRLLPDGAIKSLLSAAISPVIASLFLYISMHKYGYRRNTTYEKKSYMTETFIPIIVSVMLLMTIWLFASYNPENPYFALAYEEDFSSYLLRVGPSTILQIIFYVTAMFVGYTGGYKRREKDRQKMMAEQNNQKLKG